MVAYLIYIRNGFTYGWSRCGACGVRQHLLLFASVVFYETFVAQGLDVGSTIQSGISAGC